MAVSRINPLRPSIRLSPAHSRENSRSTSPERNPASLYQKIDPLLANLSPESTLHALTSTEAVPSGEQFAHDVLSQSISKVSPAERALGIRAAIAAQSLSLWYKEVQSWTWPKQNDAAAGKGFLPPTDTVVEGNALNSSSEKSSSVDTVEYYGSLPAGVVEQYEQRIEEIRDGMDNLDVEELKAHVLNAHIPSRSRPSSSTSTASGPPPLSYIQLSDFTAIVTATILRALPSLSRLSSLLSTWDVRLLVLRQIPGLLRELIATRSALDASFHALRSFDPAKTTKSALSESHIRAEHGKLESSVVGVGRRMDRVLDALEGRQDSLPESWIDNLESIESDFAAWAVEAEKYRFRIQWLLAQEHAKEAETEEESEPCPEYSTDQSTRHVVESEDLESQSPIKLPEAEPQPIMPAPSTLTSHEREARAAAEASTDGQPEGHTTPEPEIASCDRSFDGGTEQTAFKESSIAAEDVEHDMPEVLKTRTSPVLLPHHAFDQQEPLTPSRVPLPATPAGENKENIPPQAVEYSSVLASPSRDSRPLAPRERELIESFVQGPALSESSGATGVPDLAVSINASDNETSNVLQDLRSTDSEVVDKAKGNQNEVTMPIEPAQLNHPPVQTGPVTPIHEPAEFMTGESFSTGKPMSPNEKVMPSVRTFSMASDRAADAFAAVIETSNPQAQQPVPSNSTECELKPGKVRPQPADGNTLQKSTSRKPLQSPIKLSKVGRLKLDDHTPMPRPRRPSAGSAVSLLSDNSSLSSPDIHDPYTSSSNDHLTPSRSSDPHSHSRTPQDDHVLRGDHLLDLGNTQLPPRAAFQPNRTVSLPLERFINENFSFDVDDESTPSMTGFEGVTKSSVTTQFSKEASSTPTPPFPRLLRRRPMLTRGKSASDLNSGGKKPQHTEPNAKVFGQNTAHRAMLHHEQPKSLRLRKRLIAHPSLESLGVKRQELAYVEENESELTDFGTRASSPNKRSKQPRDHLDEKITSILSSLPGRIHLVDPNNEADTSSSSSSSVGRKARDKYPSDSPHGQMTPNATPAPSLTLMPAARRRSSHAHKSEETSVKLYHLHHGGQTAPTKLFVRTVGEDGQRVMVRVGGGWADLGEYLREYVIHHGRRKVSETPRVEVQGMGSRASPGYSPSTMLTPAALAHHTSGRATPSRPPSVLSVRPPSSLTVHKVRRGSNASDASAIAPRSVTTGTLNSLTSPPTIPTGRRRLSVSSSYSTGHHTPANMASGHTHDALSKPLGLAGPKPRSRQISMSPEGEAWVEDVLQQTRRSSSLNPPPFALNIAPENVPVERHDAPENVHVLPKVRSFGDIRSNGTNRRVVLKGLGSRR